LERPAVIECGPQPPAGRASRAARSGAARKAGTAPQRVRCDATQSRVAAT
jgi:hypothetical protein